MTHDIDTLARDIHGISTSKGFKSPDLDNLPEKLMLSVSELAEAMEEHRKNRGLRYYVDGKPEGILPELADSIIRNLHMMQALLDGPKPAALDGVTAGDIIAEKVEFNRGRPYLHGSNSY